MPASISSHSLARRPDGLEIEFAQPAPIQQHDLPLGLAEEAENTLCRDTVSNVQFSLKVLEPNKISRMFPGMPEMEISYYRCQI